MCIVGTYLRTTEYTRRWQDWVLFRNNFINADSASAKYRWNHWAGQWAHSEFMRSGETDIFSLEATNFMHANDSEELKHPNTVCSVGKIGQAVNILSS